MGMFSMDTLIVIAFTFVLYMMMYPGNLVTLPSSHSDKTMQEMTHGMLFSFMVVLLSPFVLKMVSKYMVKPVASAFS